MLWQSANHFRLTRYNSANTKKLSASQSRDRSFAGQRDSDGGVVRQCSRVLRLPSGRGGVFAARHIERRQLPPLDTDHFDRHRDRPPEPAEPSAVGDNELESCRQPCARPAGRSRASKNGRRAPAGRSDRRPARVAENAGSCARPSASACWRHPCRSAAPWPGPARWADWKPSHRLEASRRRSKPLP